VPPLPSTSPRPPTSPDGSHRPSWLPAKTTPSPPPPHHKPVYPSSLLHSFSPNPRTPLCRFSSSHPPRRPPLYRHPLAKSPLVASPSADLTIPFFTELYFTTSPFNEHSWSPRSISPLIRSRQSLHYPDQCNSGHTFPDPLPGLSFSVHQSPTGLFFLNDCSKKKHRTRTVVTSLETNSCIFLFGFSFLFIRRVARFSLFAFSTARVSLP